MTFRLLRHCLCIVFIIAIGGNSAADLKSTTIPRYDVAVEKSVAYLQQLRAIDVRDKGIVAYALLKAGVEPTDPLVAEGIALAKGRAAAGNAYTHYVGTYVASVDAMLLADVGGTKYRREVQQIADHILAIQEKNGSWSNKPGNPGDVSLLQYSILAIWAAQRVGCTIDKAAFDRVASFLLKHSSSDGGWGYRPGTKKGEGEGLSTHNMTLAAIGTLSISRQILFPGEARDRPAGKKFGVLDTGTYIPTVSADSMDRAIDRGLAWIQARFAPIPPTKFQLYFYYTLERAGALEGLQEGWYTTYGDGLLTLQAADGHFESLHASVGPEVATSFAVLYFMRSTQQILDYGLGIQVGGRDVESLFYGKKSKTELGPLDSLLKAMEGQDFASLDISTDDLVQKIQFSSRDELIGETEKLRALLKSPDPANRQVAYWALGRTCDFDLIPMMLEGLKDPSIDVNVEAIAALRYIARKPNGFDLTFDPLESLPKKASEDERVKAANDWRRKALKTWQTWYAGVRPYESSDGLDESNR